MSTSAAVASLLRPAITRTMLTVFVIGDVLGAGIYALVGEVAGETGGAIWTGFAAAGVLAFFTAASYAELVTKYPQAAGAALYVHRAWCTPFFTFLAAFAVVLLGRHLGGNPCDGFRGVVLVAGGAGRHGAGARDRAREARRLSQSRRDQVCSTRSWPKAWCSPDSTSSKPARS